MSDTAPWRERALSFLIEQADVIAIVGLIVTVIIFILQQRRANRLEKQENYLRLELASNDVFRFEAEHSARLAPYTAEYFDSSTVDHADDTVAEAFFYMTLNLFEISVRFRKDLTIDKHVFGSWVVWYYDILCCGFFRRMWPDYRVNYTKDLREVFDHPVETFDIEMDDAERRQRFFNHVAVVLDCPIVQEWVPEPLAETRRVAAPSGVRIEWVGPEALDVAEFGRFFVHNIRQDTRYISHSEYFEGLSPDGEIWAEDLDARFAKGFGPDSGRECCLARDAQGRLIGAAVLRHASNGWERYAVLEDMTVDGEWRRGGVGQTVMTAVAERATGRGAARLLMESGARNAKAHAFFARNGFRVFSKTFCRPL